MNCFPFGSTYRGERKKMQPMNVSKRATTSMSLACVWTINKRKHEKLSQRSCAVVACAKKLQVIDLESALGFCGKLLLRPRVHRSSVLVSHSSRENVNVNIDGNQLIRPKFSWAKLFLLSIEESSSRCREWDIKHRMVRPHREQARRKTHLVPAGRVRDVNNFEFSARCQSVGVPASGRRRKRTIWELRYRQSSLVFVETLFEWKV